MGLGNSNNSGRKFITIVGGKWTLRVTEDTEGAVARALTNGPNEGTDVHELYFDHLDGMIVGGEIKDGKYGMDICFDIDDDGEKFTVQIPLQSAYFGTIAKVSPNIDPTQKIFLGMGFDTEKKKPFMYVQQNGETVRAAFTKAEPNGMPEAFKEKVMGKEQWNFQAQEQFLFEKIEEFFERSFGAESGAQAPAKPAPEVAPAVEAEPDLSQFDDDVPFD